MRQRTPVGAGAGDLIADPREGRQYCRHRMVLTPKGRDALTSSTRAAKKRKLE